MNRNTKCFDYDSWNKINQNSEVKPKYFLYLSERNLTRLIYIHSPFKLASKLKPICSCKNVPTLIKLYFLMVVKFEMVLIISNWEISKIWAVQNREYFRWERKMWLDVCRYVKWPFDDNLSGIWRKKGIIHAFRNVCEIFYIPSH